MAVQYLAQSGGVTNLAAATARSMLEVASSANLPPEWVTISAANMATSGYTVLSLSTSTGSVTGTSLTPRRFGQALGTYDGTIKNLITAEGTGVADFFALAFANPFTYERDFPLGRENFQATGTFMQIRLLSSVAGSAAAPAYANLLIEV